MSSLLDIKTMNYCDFVGYINQTNNPPGAYNTLSQWAMFAKIKEQHRILEVACTTGYSIREICKMTGASGFGFDLSGQAVEAAKKNAESIGLAHKLNFLEADGYKIEIEEKFDHIILGAALGFFPDQKKMLEKCLTHLNDQGNILASPFYVTNEIPHDVVKITQERLGITPTNLPYKVVMEVYDGLDIVYESRSDIYAETDEEIKRYCESTINRFQREKNIQDSSVLDYAFDRLLNIKQVCNLLRPYQTYSVLVLRYNKNEYPNRYVELF
jgi:ubiquinone/menaquinone biosynthesis C-methylase UbiE